MQFQAICSKWSKKLTLSLSAANIEEARSLLHSQGYSIMELKEITQENKSVSKDTNFFYFDIRINGQIKTGKIQSDDVFKSYKKLIEDLGYDVIYIYTNEWMNEEQKKIITAKVRDSYRMYKESIWENIDDHKIETKDEKEIQEISPQILREVERYWLIIDSTIEKIQNLMLKYHNTIPDDKKLWLEAIERILLQSKWSSNLGKIKMNVEDALKKVWEIELVLVKDQMGDEKKRFLEETNSLLKQIGSSNRIETKKSESLDIGKALSSFFGKITTKSEDKKEAKKIDTNSFIYYKNQRELNLYNESLNQTDIQILKAIFTFQFSKVKRLRLKKKLLLQNIQIIDNRINNKNISYTKIVHGFQYYLDAFLKTIDAFSRVLTYALFFYVLTYFTLNILAYFDVLHFDLQANKMFLYITIISLIAAILSFVRTIWGFVLSLPLFYIIVYFLSINF